MANLALSVALVDPMMGFRCFHSKMVLQENFEFDYVYVINYWFGEMFLASWYCHSLLTSSWSMIFEYNWIKCTEEVLWPIWQFKPLAIGVLKLISASFLKSVFNLYLKHSFTYKHFAVHFTPCFIENKIKGVQWSFKLIIFYQWYQYQKYWHHTCIIRIICYVYVYEQLSTYAPEANNSKPMWYEYHEIYLIANTIMKQI